MTKPAHAWSDERRARFVLENEGRVRTFAHFFWLWRGEHGDKYQIMGNCANGTCDMDFDTFDDWWKWYGKDFKGLDMERGEERIWITNTTDSPGFKEGLIDRINIPGISKDDIVFDRPKDTEHYTVEELEEMGTIGAYIKTKDES